MNNDLISREALKAAFYNRKRTPDDMKYLRVPAELVYQFIDNAPTVEVGYLTNCANCEKVEKIRAKRPQGKWIPVSERLPEESLNSVIGWDSYREKCVFVQYIDGHFQITGNDESFDIVAWQPLPEPYQKGGAE